MPRSRLPAQVRVSMRQDPDGRWRASSADGRVNASAQSRESCLRSVRNQAAGRTVLLVEVWPKLLGVAEAAELLGWDKRRVITYLDRGSFPVPMASLAGGRVWALDDVREFARAFRTRQRARKRRAWA
ncbi:MAG TPA: hypothetical protein VGS09_10785 [Actinomycetota bacterium]|jgi:hypothetical protein|nr:hypothetical protein [Actinomycetota bacterium]